MANTATTDRTSAYARAVVAGTIVAGRLVRLACERHLRDLETGAERGLRFDVAAADYAINFFGLLRLPQDGELDGKPFTLEPFQAFIVGSLFGWKGPDGFRRFRTAYVEQGKGNGKSPMAAGIGLFGLLADDEAAAEIYAAATKLEQARVLFRDAKLMIDASPALRARLDVGLASIAFHKTGSFFKPVSSEKRGLDGPRPHMGLIDELHEHPDATVVNKLRAGTKARRQALIFEITNSGYDRLSVCWDHHEYSRKILEGTLTDDSWFAYVCGLDPCERCRAAGKDQPADGCKECDDWRDEACWPKANPGLDTILPRKYLREQVHEAEGMPSKEAIVKRLNFTIWTVGVVRAIPMDKWAACGRGVGPKAWRESRLQRLAGQTCYGGLDLASTSDLTALVLVFAAERGVEILPFFWIPAESAKRRTGDDRVPYLQWIREGWITTTEGDTTDYDEVRRDINAIGEEFAIRELAVDYRFQGAQLCTQLTSDGFEVIAFGQGFGAMAAPTTRLLELVKAEEFAHGNNPVLGWHASNAVTVTDPDGNQRFSKAKSAEKIDGIIGATMGLGRLMLSDGGGSVYDSQGIDYL